MKILNLKVIWFHYVNDVEDITYILKNKDKKKFIFKYLEDDDFPELNFTTK